jgi:23S rRNA (uridine2552-2'-O)-methyltransferase
MARRGFGSRGPRSSKKGGSPRKDHYFYKAKRESFAARAVYKLQQIDQKFQVFEKGQRVLDLGCHPGSWMQYASGRVGRSGMIVGIDRTETVLLTENVRVVTADVYEFTWQTLGEPPKSFDVVLSDMAPNTTGIRSVDQQKSAALAERALELADQFCKPGGRFVVKIFMGPDEAVLFTELKKRFEKVSRFKPDASKPDSTEIYLVGLGMAAAEQNQES